MLVLRRAFALATLSTLMTFTSLGRGAMALAYAGAVGIALYRSGGKELLAAKW